MELQVFLSTSAKTQRIVRASRKLWLAHTPFEPEFIDLGVSDLTRWTQNVCKALAQFDLAPFLIFGLDDYLVDAFDAEVYWRVLKFVENNSISRYEMAHTFHRKPDVQVIERCGMFDIVEMGQTASYRMSCQISVWDTGYFLKRLTTPRTPWGFEVQETKEAENDGARIIGTVGGSALRYGTQSALSKKWDGINLAGLSDPNRATIASELGE